jgi:hypothetical protein
MLVFRYPPIIHKVNDKLKTRGFVHAICNAAISKRRKVFELEKMKPGERLCSTCFTFEEKMKIVIYSENQTLPF